LTDLEAIINKCKKNDRQAQVVLYNWIAPKLLGLCLRYFKDRSEAEDIMQDSVVKIFMNIESYRFEGSFEVWCKRIAANTSLNWLKSKKRLQFDRDTNHLENLGDTIEEEIQLDENELLNCLNELPQGYRTVLNLFLFENFSHKEIGNQLGIAESTSRSQYARAKQLLIALMKKRTSQDESKLVG
jgi:RNA polymerase sigma factor (sigma-70 family)